MIRLFVPDPLAPGTSVSLGRARAHYLVDVMRLGAGGVLLAFNGRDGEWRCAIARSPDGWSLDALARTRPQAPGPDLELLAALIRRPRLETVVEKAAELGVARVRLISTERTQPTQANIGRLTAIATEGAEQTGALYVPEIVAPVRLSEALKGFRSDRRLLFCDEAGDGTPALEALRGEEGEAWAILIGPEGGFSAAEREAVRATAGVVAVSLGPRILRADTAAIVAMALWQASRGDWRGT